MKKIALALLLLVSCNLHAMSMRITKIIEDHNLYVLDDKYVIKSSSNILDKGLGDYLDIDIDCFYTQTYWLQDVVTTRYEHVGTTYDLGAQTYVDGYTGDTVTYHNTPQFHYEYVDYVNTYTLTPVGLMEKHPLSLDGFVSVAESRSGEQPLKSYTSTYTDTGWFWNDKDVDRENFTSAVQTGTYVDITWLIDKYALLPTNWTQEIYLIYDRTNPRYLAGVLNCSYTRKLFLHDYIYSLALFEYNY